MAELFTTAELVGHWLAIFLTFCILSFLYKDNPFYKFAEHLFVGVSIGYIVIQQYYSVLEPKLVDQLGDRRWLALVPLALCLMLLTKMVSRRLAWVARFPLAFVVGLYAGFAIKTVQADLGAQMTESMKSVDAVKLDINTAGEKELSQLPGIGPETARAIIERRAAEPFRSLDEVAGLPGLTEAQRRQIADERGRFTGLDAQAATAPGERDYFGIFSDLLLLSGLLASLIYFYFSIEQKGAVGKVSRYGVWILMIGFGASFGYTVQGRLALAIGRAMDVLGKNKEPALADRIHGPLVGCLSIAIIVIGIVIWERRGRARGGQSG